MDIVGMFPNTPVAKTLEVVREERESDNTLSARTKWTSGFIFLIETYFKTMDDRIYFQRWATDWKVDFEIVGGNIHALVQEEFCFQLR